MLETYILIPEILQQHTRIGRDKCRVLVEEVNSEDLKVYCRDIKSEATGCRVDYYIGDKWISGCPLRNTCLGVFGADKTLIEENIGMIVED